MHHLSLLGRFCLKGKHEPAFCNTKLQTDLGLLLSLKANLAKVEISHKLAAKVFEKLLNWPLLDAKAFYQASK